MRQFALIGLACVIALFAGCKSKGMNRPPQPTAESAERRASTIRDYAENVRRAPDATTEAAELEQFRQFAADKGYTYTVRTFRMDSEEQVHHAAGYAGLVRAQVEVYQADRVVETFYFTPKDNRNLTIIAKG